MIILAFILESSELGVSTGRYG